MPSSVEVLASAVRRLIDKVHELEADVKPPVSVDDELKPIIDEIDAIVPEPVVESVPSGPSNMANVPENPPAEEEHLPS